MSRRTVWLASYPKSGNTWVRALLAGVKDGAVDINRMAGDSIASARGPFEHLTGLVSSELRREEVQALRPLVDAALDAQLPATDAQPWYRKIHDGLFTGLAGAPIVPPEATRGAVYVVRDPRDVAVSYAHHLSIPLAEAVRGMRSPAGHMAAGHQRPLPQFTQRLGTWSDHVVSWLDHDLFPVLLVRYEDLQADAPGELRRISRTLGQPADEAALTAAAHGARFDVLRAQETKDGFRERPGADRTFFRRGVAGAWRDELPAELAAEVQADHHDVMVRLGYLPSPDTTTPAPGGASTP